MDVPGAPGVVIKDVWELQEQIGKGSFAVVWKAQHRSDGRLAAVKEISTEKLNSKLQESLESEVAVLLRAKHQNIVKLYDVLSTPKRLHLVLEYLAGGDLHQLLRRGRLPEQAARHFLQQLGAGLQALRLHNYIHRDLKPQNLLLSEPTPRAVLKIADFGFARSLSPGQGLAETLCGSPLYMAPEILQYQKYDAKADLWSVGAILFEMVSGRPPFGGANHIHLLRSIERSEAKLPDVVASELSTSCVRLIKQLLKRNPVERLSFDEFFRHPFLGLDVPAAAAAAGPSRLVSASSFSKQPAAAPGRGAEQAADAAAAPAAAASAAGARGASGGGADPADAPPSSSSAAASAGGAAAAAEGPPSPSVVKVTEVCSPYVRPSRVSMIARESDLDGGTPSGDLAAGSAAAAGAAAAAGHSQRGDHASASGSSAAAASASASGAGASSSGASGSQALGGPSPQPSPRQQSAAPPSPDRRSGGYAAATPGSRPSSGGTHRTPSREQQQQQSLDSSSESLADIDDYVLVQAPSIGAPRPAGGSGPASSGAGAGAAGGRAASSLSSAVEVSALASLPGSATAASSALGLSASPPAGSTPPGPAAGASGVLRQAGGTPASAPRAVPGAQPRGGAGASSSSSSQGGFSVGLPPMPPHRSPSNAGGSGFPAMHQSPLSAAAGGGGGGFSSQPPFPTASPFSGAAASPPQQLAFSPAGPPPLPPGREPSPGLGAGAGAPLPPASFSGPGANLGEMGRVMSERMAVRMGSVPSSPGGAADGGAGSSSSTIARVASSPAFLLFAQQPSSPQMAPDERFLSLETVGHILESLATEKAAGGEALAALALFVLSVTTMDAALRLARSCTDLLPSARAALHSRLAAVLDRAASLAASLGGGAVGGGGGAEASARGAETVVPDAPSLAFESALSFGRHGAVEELMGNVQAAEGLYGKSVCILKFLLFELPRIDQKDPFALDAPSRARLSKYQAEIEARRTACAAAAASAAEARRPPPAPPPVSPPPPPQQQQPASPSAAAGGGLLQQRPPQRSGSSASVVSLTALGTSPKGEPAPLVPADSDPLGASLLLAGGGSSSGGGGRGSSCGSR